MCKCNKIDYVIKLGKTLTCPLAFHRGAGEWGYLKFASHSSS